jgi:signal transduction histidine kinase
MGSGICVILEAVALAAHDLESRPSHDRPEVHHRPAKGLEMTTSNDLDPPTEDRETVAHYLDDTDTLVHQMFAVGLDLHAALARIEHDNGQRRAAERIRQAIDCLDQAISEFRTAVVGHREAEDPEGRDRTSRPSPSS